MKRAPFIASYTLFDRTFNNKGGTFDRGTSFRTTFEARGLYRVFFMAAVLFFVLFLSTQRSFAFGKKDAPDTESVSEPKKSIFDIDISSRDAHGNTPLHLAAMDGDTDLVEFLLFKKADTTLTNTSGLTPLQEALINNEDGSNRGAIIALVNAPSDIYFPLPCGDATIDYALEQSYDYYDIFINEKTKDYRDKDGEALLSHLVATKNTVAVDCYISKRLDLSIKDSNGDNALDITFSKMALEHDKDLTQIAANLATAGLVPNKSSDYDYFFQAVASRDLNKRSDSGQCPLSLATIKGDECVVQYLLDHGAMTKTQDTSGSTPLHEAVRYGRLDIAKQLCGYLAPVNARDNIGKTPLLLAMDYDSDSVNAMYTLLLDNGADTSVKDSYGDTVLHTATMTAVDTNVLVMLKDNGADIDARNKDGVTPLLIALLNKITSHVEFYARNRASITTRDNEGRTPLTVALQSNEKYLMTIVNKANVDKPDSNGDSPLHTAIKENASLSKIQYILSLMDNVNSQNARGDTALYLSVIKNRPKLGALLIARGADIFTTNNKNLSPLSLALNSNSTVMDWLLNDSTIKATDGAGNTALHYAADWGSTSAILSIVQKGGDANARNTLGKTPIFTACHRGALGGATGSGALTIDQLVLQGALVNTRDNMGLTPLHEAVQYGDLGAVQKLLSLGSVVDSLSSSGLSPLALAIAGNKLDAARVLLDFGAKCDTQNILGETPLVAAIKSNNIDAVRLLLSYNAPLDTQDLLGRTAFHIAALLGDNKMIALIKSAGGQALCRDRNGDTPFSLYLKREDFLDGTLSVLLGDDKNLRDSDGNSPIHIAISSHAPIKILSSLVMLGYSLDSRNSAGLTPIALAVKNNDAAQAQLLLANGADPFVMVDKTNNAVSIALKLGNEDIIDSIAKYSGDKTDTAGNTLLHYAALNADKNMLTKLLTWGLDLNARNNVGETPYMTAIRWNKNENARTLAPATAG